MLAMRPMVIVPTYNERENLRLLVPRAARDSRPAGDGGGRRVTGRDGIRSGRTGDAQRRTRVGAASNGTARSGPCLPGWHPPRTRHGCGRHLPDGRGPPPTNPVISPRCSTRSSVLTSSSVPAYVPAGRIVNWPLRRKLLSAGANAYIRAICSIRRARLHERLPLLAPRRPGLASAPSHRRRRLCPSSLQLLDEALAIGCTVAEVPITFVERERGD